MIMNAVGEHDFCAGEPLQVWFDEVEGSYLLIAALKRQTLNSQFAFLL
jgi:hypothetical protein